MFAPEFIYKKCPWWHKLFRRFKWFKCWKCVPIKFKGVRLPVIPVLSTLDLEEIAKVQPLTDSIGSVFYLDVKYEDEKK
jgi:hypothetical protein